MTAFLSSRTVGPAEVTTLSTTTPVYLDDVMAVSTVDSRGLDLYPALSPVGDTVASISGIMVKRTDGLPMAAGDLVITPPTYASPWISANAAGVPAMAINWWQGVGALSLISTDGGDVTYAIAVSFVTTANRRLTYTAVQVVSAEVG